MSFKAKIRINTDTTQDQRARTGRCGDCPSRARFECLSRRFAFRDFNAVEQARKVHVGLFCDLDVAVIAGDNADFDLLEPLDQARLRRYR